MTYTTKQIAEKYNVPVAKVKKWGAQFSVMQDHDNNYLWTDRAISLINRDRAFSGMYKHTKKTKVKLDSWFTMNQAKGKGFATKKLLTALG